MADDVGICAAAFFQSKGKGVVTENEFLMDISLSKRWMPYADAEKLLARMIDEGIVVKDGEYVRPKFDVSETDVPVGYRPPADLVKPSGKVSAKAKEEDIFQTLMSRSIQMGIDRKAFLASCRSLQKKMNIEVEVAALIVLRDHGADISPFTDAVYQAVAKR